MKTIKKDELFANLSQFLKSKGIELSEGTLSNNLRDGCNLLSDAINITQTTVKKAKDKVDKKLDDLRQSIHSATAPMTGTGQPVPEPSAQPAPAPAPSKPARRRRPAKKTVRKPKAASSKRPPPRPKTGRRK